MQYMIKCLKKKWIENKVRKGRPIKLTKRYERFIIRKIVKNPHLSAVKVSAKFNEKFSTSISMINKPETYWNNGLFADESKFNIFGSDGRITLWRRKNEELHTKNLVKRGGGGFLVKGCTSAPGLGHMVFLDSIMNHSLYFNILRDILKLSLKIWVLKRTLFFIMIPILSTALNVRLLCL